MTGLNRNFTASSSMSDASTATMSDSQYSHAVASVPMMDQQHWSKTLSAQIDATQRRPSVTETSSTASEDFGISHFDLDDRSSNNAATAVCSIARDSAGSSVSIASSTGSDASEMRWEARRARERAEQEADQKLIDAVCKASLLEYNEKERVLRNYENELASNDVDLHSGTTMLLQQRLDAEKRKREAMQRVINSKQTAQQMATKAREATGLYEQKNAERLAKTAELEQIQQQNERELALLAVQQRKEEAIRRREEAERRAKEAKEKAEAMRSKAFQAVQVVREQSRKQIETELIHEEDHRQLEMQRKLQELETEKALARDRREAAARKAAEAQRRAQELRARADAARAALEASAAAKQS
uniref:Uncharacterized protein n=1 Tax=Globisporangium ultimum (strain ATCC 200006 / CBS 805.95 / DAOM BR144) TaxID=431595 RepID=K3X680_GLOUD